MIGVGPKPQGLRRPTPTTRRRSPNWCRRRIGGSVDRSFIGVLLVITAVVPTTMPRSPTGCGSKVGPSGCEATDGGKDHETHWVDRGRYGRHRVRRKGRAPLPNHGCGKARDEATRRRRPQIAGVAPCIAGRPPDAWRATAVSNVSIPHRTAPPPRVSPGGVAWFPARPSRTLGAGDRPPMKARTVHAAPQPTRRLLQGSSAWGD